MTTPPEQNPSLAYVHPGPYGSLPDDQTSDQTDTQTSAPDFFRDHYPEMQLPLHDTLPPSVALPAHRLNDDPEDRVLHSLLRISIRLERLENLMISNTSSLNTAHEKLNWIHGALTTVVNVLSSVQQAALSMGGPMGSMIRKMAGGNGNG